MSASTGPAPKSFCELEGVDCAAALKKTEEDIHHYQTKVNPFQSPLEKEYLGVVGKMLMNEPLTDRDREVFRICNRGPNVPSACGVPE